MKHEPHEPIDPQLRHLMQGSLPPVDTKLRRDLWHDMEDRLAARGARKRRVAPIKLKWWEWALAAGDLGAAFYAPEAIPALLYHL